jgi:hypothetical protein
MRIEPTQKNAGIGKSSPSQPETSQHVTTPARTDHVQLSVLSQAAAGLDPAASKPSVEVRSEPPSERQRSQPPHRRFLPDSIK